MKVALASAGVLVAAVGAALFLSCADPVHDNEVAALGPEAPGISPGPDHRAGQPCLTCHGGSGPGGQQFSIGGTIFTAKSAAEPNCGSTGSGAAPCELPGVIVHLTDAHGSTVQVTSNDVGNFYIRSSDWTPEAPISVSIECSLQMNTLMMNTHVGTDGSCAACHFGTPGPTTPGPVYMYLDLSDYPGACQ